MYDLGAQPRRFSVSIGFGAEETVVGVSGELDMATAPQLGQVLDVVVDQAGPDVVLDLAELDFVDPCGLRVLAATSTRLRLSGRKLTLRSVPAMTRRILDVTGIGDFLDRAADPRPVARGILRRPGHRSCTATGRQAALDLAAVATLPVPDGVVDTALGLVVALARTSVAGADGVSVSLYRGGELTTVAATDETICQMDRDQYATNQGPCVAAAAEGRRFHVEALASEDRWPDFVPRAVRGGISSILSTPLLIGARPVGALNIYSNTAGSFGPPEHELAAMFATQASGILADARIDAATEELSRRLQGALVVREVIAQAQGVLMERTGMSVEEAFTALRRSALDPPAPLARRAAEVVASTRLLLDPSAGVGGLR